ncbi:hypothetical protein [Haloarcula halophila]|uniref:hypothetical protein n=1 Tax=Haloarcula TaxID=2237 RepID=UPI0023E451E5|nr:hypothetical protein [Halomicroarcula sp. DFY41]
MSRTATRSTAEPQLPAGYTVDRHDPEKFVLRCPDCGNRDVSDTRPGTGAQTCVRCNRLRGVTPVAVADSPSDYDTDHFEQDPGPELCGAECRDGTTCEHRAESCPIPSHDEPDGRLVTDGGGNYPLSFLCGLAGEVTDWMAKAPRGEREDISGEVWAYALATFVDGTPLTPRGYVESEHFSPDESGGRLVTDGGTETYSDTGFTSTEPDREYQHCVLCGDELEGAIEWDTGVCQECADL